MTTGVSLSPAPASGDGAPAAAAPVAPVAPAAAPVAPVAPAATPGNGSPAPTTAPAQGGVSLSTPPATPPAGDNASSPFASLSQEAKAWADGKGWKSLDDAFKSHKELETKFSQTRPVEPPKDISAYDGIQKPDDAATIGYNDDFAKWLKETGLKLKAPAETVKGFHDEFVSWARTQVGKVGETRTADTQQRVDKAASELTKSWGSPNTPKFARNLDMAMRAINNLSPTLKDALVETGVIANVGGKEMVANHVIIDALAKAGAAMYAEDTLYGSVATSANPFDPATLDVTKQTQLFRTDKAKAASYIRALKPEHQQRYATLLTQLEGA